jgi:hypothetical protein
VSEYSCERVFILQNGMRKKYPSEEGTGLYVFVADDYMALPDDTELSICPQFYYRSYSQKHA